ncbi:glycine betaine/L-proline ABC transporter substrate-binding protein ProX, partial [bacterium]|nr:glycine betaine/L-proline ABC transporter substrate-binding protein ProX [bacterium]
MGLRKPECWKREIGKRNWSMRAASVLLMILLLLGAVKTEAQNDAGSAKNAEVVRIARATWDTGWFQTEVFRELLHELGYATAEPRTMDNREFYHAAARGEMDFWANGWFPSHVGFLEEPSVAGKVEAVGYEVRTGAIQGYLVDKASAETYGITKLTDFQDPQVASHFDRDGDGRADLIGCNVGWGCERVVKHHLDVCNLTTSVEHVQGDYAPMMYETIERYRKGEPVFFYTWTPNWTVGVLKPGTDVVWIEMPNASEATTHTGIQG